MLEPVPAGRFVAGLFACLLASCNNPGRPALTAYGGASTDGTLVRDILLFGGFTVEDSYLAAIAVSEPVYYHERYQWEVEGQVVKHFGLQDHWEFNALIALRWKYFPWNKHVKTSFAVGDGLSYATEVPLLEDLDEPETGSTRLLNYLLIELTFAPPKEEHWAFVFRIHHRSGIFGVFDDVSGGSNVIALGIKYTF